MTTPLAPAEIEVELKDLPEWSFDDNKLYREYQFPSFRDAIAFVGRLAFDAEELNHHPEIFMVFNRVALSLSTHDAGDVVTSRDLVLAKKIEQRARLFLA